MVVAAVMMRRTGHSGGAIADEGRWGKGAEAAVAPSHSFQALGTSLIGTSRSAWVHCPSDFISAPAAMVA